MWFDPGARLPLRPRPGRGRVGGFTLLELMIALVVLGVLLAVAFPSYQSAVRKGRRADAFAAIAAVQQAQERHRANQITYAGNLNATPDPLTLRQVSATSANGHYTLALSDHSASGYTVTATGVGSQAADGSCTVLGARAEAGRLVYGSGATSIDWSNPAAADAGRCWPK